MMAGNYDLQHLIDNNARWAARVVKNDPGFFRRLVAQQAPEYLWIGCADSRVPANEVVDLAPGELFVHRNVANVVNHSDVNCQSVIQFAVDVLKIKHIMVVGHYGCSGVRAALTCQRVNGVADHWLGHVRDVACRHQPLIDLEPDEAHRFSLLCELNVLEQALNVCSSLTVQDAWARGQPLTVHGWIYGLGDGLVRHLDVAVSGPADLGQLRERAVRGISEARRTHTNRPD
ncbi:carbonate dehydratase [Stagnimonas aquatica]|uniref:Carbonic anhydrase 2 n=2 Tax=Stagnimonas aquatica TaxID=2689987 RepID=A0A3N0VDG5_9GAMM|nr:carbonate dehydratase [Stagnimonas aquatica]